ncbi:hypothetical protein KNU91_gp014 [Enterococcus phage nattely]|uniref:Uncharacterized protein n=1 Tax=Enterococcus phage nattely TaxID=2719593 RepID=A0A6G9LMG1_9CAUD|nr:hypothetical protein KNU91_gp014 [Enterococcus phage nattely]QIQ66181.1 hypothetical protein nattely_14 [Enterococcus phage nattely]
MTEKMINCEYDDKFFINKSINLGGEYVAQFQMTESDGNCYVDQVSLNKEACIDLVKFLKKEMEIKDEELV